MPTVNEVLGGWLESAAKNPKSTAQGIISVLLGLVPFLVLCHLTSPTFAVSLASTLGGAKVYIAGLQVDPEKKSVADVKNSDQVLVPAGSAEEK